MLFEDGMEKGIEKGVQQGLGRANALNVKLAECRKGGRHYPGSIG